MKSWRGITLFLVAYIFSSFLRNESVAGPTVQPRLQCYTCYSETSWDDCDNNLTPHFCQNGEEVCVKMRLIKRIANDTYKRQYTKHCAFASYCSDKECKRYSWACKVDCCNGDLCNTSTANWANFMFVLTFFCLQAIIY